MGTNKCVGVLTSGNGGHTKAVSCLTYIPAPQGGEAYIASGGIDCEVKLWKASTGDFAGSASHPAMVTTMCYFQDSNGSKYPFLIMDSD